VALSARPLRWSTKHCVQAHAVFTAPPGSPPLAACRWGSPCWHSRTALRSQHTGTAAEPRHSRQQQQHSSSRRRNEYTLRTRRVSCSTGQGLLAAQPSTCRWCLLHVPSTTICIAHSRNKQAKQDQKATCFMLLVCCFAHQVCICAVHQSHAALPHPAHHTQILLVDALLVSTAQRRCCCCCCCCCSRLRVAGQLTSSSSSNTCRGVIMRVQQRLVGLLPLLLL
jgi:hypothetical protein